MLHSLSPDSSRRACNCALVSGLHSLTIDGSVSSHESLAKILVRSIEIKILVTSIEKNFLLRLIEIIIAVAGAAAAIIGFAGKIAQEYYRQSSGPIDPCDAL